VSTVFISHSSHDNAAVMDLRDRLRGRGFESLFVDFDARDGIPAGSEWERELLHKLRLADAVVFVGSRASATSEWCLIELAFAHAASRPIFPVALEPGVRVASLQSWQWVQLNGSDGFERLARALAQRFDPARSVPWDHTRPPYPGLEPFQMADAAVFFGRDDVIATLLERLDVIFGRRRAFALVGASGSGKSSLVRAGLAARLARERARWLVLAPFTPGERPLSALTRVLRAAGSRTNVAMRDEGAFADALRDLATTGDGRERAVLAVVDQAEELLLVSERRERERFLTLLRQQTDGVGPLRVVLTLRSEYLDAALRDEQLAELVGEPVAVSAVSRSRLPEVILAPARRAGIEYAPGLVERMVEDTRGGDALPLLAYTLRALHDRGTGGPRTIAVDDYEAIGGVDGALRRRADQVLHALDDPMTLTTLLRLVAFGPEGVPGRRRARLDDFEARERTIIKAFVDARLLVTATRGDATVVEPAHDALLRAWEPLARAIEGSRERLQGLAELRQAAEEWSRHREDDAYLLRGERLARARRHAAGESALDPSSRALLVASESAERERRQAAQQRARRLRRLNAALASLLLVAIAGTAFAVYQTRQANARRQDAQREELAATSSRLASQSAAVLPTRPRLGLLLALAAYSIDDTFEARNALVSGIEQTRRAEMAVSDVSDAVISGDDSRLVALGRAGDAQLWSIRPRRLLARIEGGRGFGGLVTSDDGRVAGALDGSGRLAIWRFGDGGGSFRRGPSFGRLPAAPLLLMSADGRYAVVPAGADRLQVVDTATADAAGSAVSARSWEADLSPDGTLLATATAQGATVWKLGPHGPAAPRERRERDVASVRFDDGGRTLVIARNHGRPVRWTVRAGAAGPKPSAAGPAETADGRIRISGAERSRGDLIRPLDPSEEVEMSPGRRWLLSRSSAGAEVWNIGRDDPFRKRLSRVGGLAASTGRTTALAPIASANGAEARGYGSIELRRPGASVVRLRAPGTSGSPEAIAFGPGPRALTALYGGIRVLWEERSDGWKLVASTPLGGGSGVLAPDGSHALMSESPRRVKLWDLTSTPPSSKTVRTPSSPEIAFAGDGRSFATSSTGFVLSTERECGVLVYRIPITRRPVCVRASRGDGYKLELALDHDGTVLATSNAAGEIAFWHPARGTRLPVPVVGNFSALASKPLDDFGLGQQPPVLAFAPDGRTLMAHDVERGNLRFIDVERQQPIGVPLPAPQSDAGDFDVRHAFAADGSRLLLSAFTDRFIGVIEVSDLAWSSDAARLRERVCQITGAGLTHQQWRELDISRPYTRQC
jgi:WD40 repeat protein